MRLSSPVLCAMVAAALLAGCSGNGGSTNSSLPNAPSSGQTSSTDARSAPLTGGFSLVPPQLRPKHAMKLHGHGISHDTASSNYGLYASEFYAQEVFGYMTPNTGNNPPGCSVSTVSYVNDVASDDGSDLIVPQGSTVAVYAGPKLCGSELGSFADTYGIASDASANNAKHSTIAVANIYDGTSYIAPAPGSISVCTLAGGCTSNLTNSNMFEVYGVVMDSNGDCWASSYDGATSGGTWLTYFQGCTGSGQTATGYDNGSPGGLDIDKDGHILAIDAYHNALYVYSGCNPTCTLVNGPQALEGGSIFGHLDRSSMDFAAADYQYGQIDVYQYNASNGKIKYKYSFNNGLNAADLVEGAAFTPRAHQ